MKVWFFPHSSFRDRQLDTIRRWPAHEILNPEIAAGRRGKQVSQAYANDSKVRMSWQQRVPLINIKLRPRGAPKEATSSPVLLSAMPFTLFSPGFRFVL